METKSSEIKRLEVELVELKAKNEATTKNLKELISQKQKEEEKAAQLEHTIAELEVAQDKTNAKLASLTSQYNDHVEKTLRREKSVTDFREIEVDDRSEEILLIKASCTSLFSRGCQKLMA